jgi:hypothetical protein
MKPIIDPSLQGKDLFRFLKENKQLMLAQKKGTFKAADPVSYGAMPVKESADKAAPAEVDSDDAITRDLVINSCYYLDSHDDVHIPGIWNKSIQELRLTYLLQEHKMQFDHIIADSDEGMGVSTRQISWRTLGLKASGQTECLVFSPRITPRAESVYVQRVQEQSC